MSNEISVSRTGLQLDAPSPGDIVTVKLKPCPRTMINFMTGQTFVEDDSKSPQHYRHTTIWRVVAANGGQAVVEAAHGYDKGRRETWAISAHDWFEASELLEALQRPPEDEDAA